MQTGSMVNHMMGNTRQPAPEIGMGATELCWTDRHAYTVVQVFSEKHIGVKRDLVTRMDKNGVSESQSYMYCPQPGAPMIHLTLRKDGRWRVRGERDGHVFALGVRREYYDYSF